MKKAFVGRLALLVSLISFCATVSLAKERGNEENSSTRHVLMLERTEDVRSDVFHKYEEKKDSLSTTGEIENKSHVWEFWSAVPDKFDDPKYVDIDVDMLGKEIACLSYIFETSFVRREKLIPGDPTERTIIKKQSVYNTTRNIGKFFRNGLKKGEINIQEATQDYSYILKVAIAVVNNEDTESFETELNNHKKDIKSQIELFKKVKLNNIYIN